MAGGAAVKKEKEVRGRGENVLGVKVIKYNSLQKNCNVGHRMKFLVSCGKWEEFFICPNLLQRLRLSSVELEKFASIIQIKISLASIPLEPSPSSCFPTLTHVSTYRVNAPSPPLCSLKPLRSGGFGFFFYLPWDLLEQVSF